MDIYMVGILILAVTAMTKIHIPPFPLSTAKLIFYSSDPHILSSSVCYALVPVIR